MNKKYIVLLSIIVPMLCKTQSQSQQQMGYDFFKGGMQATGEILADEQTAKGVGKIVSGLVQESMSGIFTGIGNSFKEGKFENLAAESSQSASRAINLGTKNINEGLEKSSIDFANAAGRSMENVMSEFQNQTGQGSEFDLAQKSFFTTTGTNINDFIQQVGFDNMKKYGAISLAITGGYYAIPVIAKYVERELLNPTPKLIIESSKKSYYESFKSLFWTSQLPLEMVFSPALKEQLDDIAKITTMINKRINEGKTNIKYRNLMLYGPPGTGKTMFAKELAKMSGLEYAFMSGSSFSKFKDGEGIQALDELFAWAKNSKGLMIFIDEAETFLSKRENMDPQSKAYQLLNNFLNYTGERSNKFMIVFATNHKDALDSAMYRRIDDLIEMPLPSKDQRMNALKLYINKILLDTKNNDKIFITSVHKHLTDKVVQSIAEKTKGLSYGDIEGIVNTLKTDADILQPAAINDVLIDKVVVRAIKKHEAFTNGKLLGSVEN